MGELLGDHFSTSNWTNSGNKAGSLPSSGENVYCAFAQLQAELSEPESFSSHPTFVNYMSFNCATVTILNCLSYNIMSERNTLVIWLTM